MGTYAGDITDLSCPVRQRAGCGVWFSSVMADAEHQLVWAAGEHGLVFGFDGMRPCAALQLPRSLVNKEHRPRLARVGDRLACGGGDSKLRLWTVSAAREEFSTSGLAGKEVAKLRPKCGLKPASEVVVLKRSATDDVKSLTGSHLLITFDRPQALASVFDVAAGQTVAELKDQHNGGALHVQRQLCASQQLAFISESDSATCKVWDLRTCKPVATIHSEAVRYSPFDRNAPSILGVPWSTGEGALAITSGADECVRAWDLRVGGTSALWTMSTGNLVGRGLAWHEGSQSLFVTTHSRHMVTYGRYCGTYQYGEELPEGWTQKRDIWPPRAVRGPAYFRKQFACDVPYLLRYAFGGPDHGEFLKWEKDTAELGREEMRKRMEEFWNPAETPAKKQRAGCEGQTPSKEPRNVMQRQ